MQRYKLGRLRNGWCAVRWQDGKRERRSLGTDDKVEAQALLDRLNAELDKAPGQTIETLWAAYMDENREKRITVRMGYSWKALAPTFAKRDATSLGIETSRDYIAERRKAGRSDGTIWTELHHLRLVLSWAAKRNRISHIPYVELPPKPAPRDRWLTRAEVTKLKHHATAPHIRMFIILAIGTGARNEALLELKWTQCDFVRGIIHLDGHRDGRTRKGRASVPMNRTVRAALLEARKSALSGHVIEWGGKPVGSVKRALAKTAKDAGIENVTAHVFRHSAAVWQAEAGISFEKIAQFLGHSDTRTTYAVYARFAPGHMQDAADVLDLDLEDIAEAVPSGSKVAVTRPKR